jgi:hypothetical protein
MLFIFQEQKRKFQPQDMENLLTKNDTDHTAKSVQGPKQDVVTDLQRQQNHVQGKTSGKTIPSASDFYTMSQRKVYVVTRKEEKVREVEDKAAFTSSFSFSKSKTGEIIVVNATTGKEATYDEWAKLVDSPTITPQEIAWLKKTIQWAGENAPIVSTLVSAYKATEAWIKYNAHEITENLAEAVEATASFVVKAAFDALGFIPGVGIGAAAVETKAGEFAVNFLKNMLGDAFKGVEHEVLSAVSKKVGEKAADGMIQKGTEYIVKNNAGTIVKVCWADIGSQGKGTGKLAENNLKMTLPQAGKNLAPAESTGVGRASQEEQEMRFKTRIGKG